MLNRMMKSNKRQFFAILVSVALIATTMVGFQFKTKAADTWHTATVGGSGISQPTATETGQNDGVWKYLLIQNQWNNMSGRYTNAAGVQGFVFDQTAYGWDGFQLQTTDLKSIYGMQSGIQYAYSITIGYTCNGSSADKTKSQNLQFQIRTGESVVVNETVDINTTGTGTGSYTFSGNYTPGANPATILMSYGQVNGSGTGAYQGSITVTSASFTGPTQAPTTTQEPTTIDPTAPQKVEAYNYYAQSKGYQVKFTGVEGASEYKVYMDDSQTALATLSGSGEYIPASTFATYADNAVHTLSVSAVNGGVESSKTPTSVRVLSKTSSAEDPTDIPRVYVVTNTGDNSTLTKAKKTTCSLTVLGGKDGVNTVAGDGTIKLRGNSTQFADKKPFNISFNSKQTVMQGRNKGKKWCLMASAYDKSFLRNKIGMSLGKVFDNVGAPEEHYVELYMNGTYIGLYEISEPADNGRSGISYDDSADSQEIQFEIEDNNRDELQDGAMYHMTGTTKQRYVTEDLEDEVSALVEERKSQGYDYDYETFLAYVDEQLADNPKYRSFVDTIEAFDKSVRNYGSSKCFEYMDVDSFVDMYLVNEIMMTTDFQYSSVKYYITIENGKPIIHAGCLWDFDLSSGNSYYPAVRQDTSLRCQNNGWFKYLMRIDKFAEKVKARFAEKQTAVRNMYEDNELGTNQIDLNVDYMSAARTRNYNVAVNPLAGTGPGWSESTADTYDTYTSTHKFAYSYSCVSPYSSYNYFQHVEYLRDWMATRIGLICDYWGTPPAEEIYTSDDTSITGYQMTANYDDVSGAIGLRTVYQFEPTVSGFKPTEVGLVFGIVTGGNPITANDVYVGSPSQYVQSHAATPAGKLDYQMGDSPTADYYALTINTPSQGVTPAAFTTHYIVRAYAKTEGGGYVYSDATEYNMYDVGDYLYKNKLISNKDSFDYIYDNMLKVVTPSYTELDYAWNNAVVDPGTINN